MPLTATANTDVRDGLSKGKAYPILGYTSSTVLVLDDNGKLQHVAIVALNDADQWSIADTDAKAAPKKETAPQPAPAQQNNTGMSGVAGGEATI